MPTPDAGNALLNDKEFSRGSFDQAVIGTHKNCSRDMQKFMVGEKNGVYSSGAGYHEAPRVSNLARGSALPKNYTDGLTGGKGVDEFTGRVTEGGFGGGGGFYEKEIDGIRKTYYGAGGGFTGGITKFYETDPDKCWGGGGGSFSADPSAKFDHYYAQYGYCEIQRLD